MAGVLKHAEMTTPAARSRLAPGVYWRAIDPQTHLGYRRRERPDGSGAPGHWMARWYIERPKYRQEMIGPADDTLKADGIHTFSYDQAVRAAKKLVQTRRAEAVAEQAGPAVTIRTAVEEYLAGRETRELKHASDIQRQDGARVWLKRDARSRLTRHVLSNERLADTKLSVLTEPDLLKWRENLPELATGTVSRLANDFKAALNRAAEKYRDRVPANFASVVKAGLSVREATAPVARPQQILTDDEVRRVVAAALVVDTDGEWQGDLFRMVCVLAATGARFSQLARMTVADVQVEKGRLMVPTSRKGRGAKAIRYTPVQVGDDLMEALRPAMSGRNGGEPLLLRPYWTSLHPHIRIGRGPWRAAAELVRPWKQIAQISRLPKGTVPYALRHSSIVRAIRAGLPLRLVAGNHDTSTAMIEKHYSAYITDAMDEVSRRAVVPLVPASDTENAKVIRLRG